MAKAYQPFVYPQGVAQQQDQIRAGAIATSLKGRNVPSAPRALTVTPGALKVTVAWEAPQVDDGGTGWRVYLDTESNLVKEITDRSVRRYDVPVEDMKKHNFFVSSVNASKRESKKVLIQGAAVGFESSTHLNPQGSIAPNQAIDYHYEFTDTTISVTIDAQTKNRSDGSQFHVLPGSKVYSGLTPSTSYYIYAYVRAKDGVMDFANPNPPSSTPNAQYAFNAGTDGRIPLPVKIITTQATGGGEPGGGTGGGGDVCPEAAELVDVQGKGEIPAIEVQVGDYIKGYCFETQSDVYRKVTGKRVSSCVAWTIVDGHRVTPCEPLYYDGKWVAAFRIPNATFDTFSGKRVDLTVESDRHESSNFWLVNGVRLLSHNWQMPVC